MKTPQEAALILDCSTSQISRYLKKNILKSTKKKHSNTRRVFITDISVENLRLEILENKKISSQISEKAKKNKERKKKELVEKSKTFSLDALGEQIMTDTTVELKELGLYRDNDRYAIFDYAMCYQIALAQTQAITEKAIIINTRGDQQVSPHATLSLAFSKLIDAKRKSLGLDPLARSKLTKVEKKDLDKMSELFGD